MDRRSLLCGLAAALAAPAVVRGGILMPLRGVVMGSDCTTIDVANQMGSTITITPALREFRVGDIITMGLGREFVITADGALVQNTGRSVPVYG
jgi:hypothetical protein